MNRKKIFLTVFILVALAQLYFPLKMILDREEILNSGKEYKFRTAPIDPTDPFRGKYITLRYKENTVEVDSGSDWVRDETVYVLLSTDSNGFAKIKSVAKEIPGPEKDYIKAKVNFAIENDAKMLTVSYPFDRYYMEETKANDAELVYRESQVDTNQVAYVLVSIKEGEAVLKDVLIDGISIKEIIDKQREKQK